MIDATTVNADNRFEAESTLSKTLAPPIAAVLPIAAFPI